MHPHRSDPLIPLETLAPDVLRAIGDGVLVVDRQMRIIYVNEQFASIYGVPPASLPGQRCADVVKFDHCRSECPHASLLAGAPGYSGHNLYCGACDSGPWCVSASPLRDESGAILGVVELYRDMKALDFYIGSLREANVALDRERQRLRDVLDDIADGYYFATPDGVITRVNSKLAHLLDRDASDLVGRHCSEVLCGDECPRDCPREWAVRHQQNIINSHTTIRIHGEKVPCDKSIIVVRGDDDQVSSVIGVIHRLSETVELKRKSRTAIEYFDIITRTSRVKEIIDFIHEAAPTDAPVLITGETGTGKELVARAIQQLSHRSRGPFVKINCSALTESLLESELFGHVKGAFTGAVSNYAGKFKKADGGTIFLDEVEDMSPGLQAKLLRVIEEQEFEPVGSNRLERVDVRIIAATNQDLTRLIAEHRFRPDLYYRLNVIRIDVPPLRERREDIPVLVDYQLERLREKYAKDVTAVSARALDVLMKHDWPGNIRQLFAALEYAFLRCQGTRIERRDLPPEVYPGVSSHVDEGEMDRESQRQRIEALLARYPRNMQRVADELGISRTTLWRRMRALGIQGPRTRPRA